MNSLEPKHVWAFAPRFRRNAFGWRSEPAITRIKEALSEIKAVAKKDPLLGAEGAVLFIRKLSPALQNIDSSSGAIGSAVYRALETLVPLIANAPAPQDMRRIWLDQLYQAHAEDQIPYIESLGDYWGELCASPELAAEWADRLKGILETMWRIEKNGGGYYHDTMLCLSAMVAAGRNEELLTLLELPPRLHWSYRRWGVKALIALGMKAEAIQYAEATEGLNEPHWQIAEACEAILLSSGLAEEAYQRYAIEANQAGTYLATFRAICRKYPHKDPDAILNDLVASRPGEEGKWFAAAKDAKRYAFALQLARKSPVDHRTLIRAARDMCESEPLFAMNCGILAIHWICAGYGYDVTVAEVRSAYDHVMHAAKLAQCQEAALTSLREVRERFPQEHFVHTALAGMVEQ